MRIPTFKNTNKALLFGKVHTNEKKIIRKLIKESKKLKRVFDKHMQKGEMKEALHLASGQKQFIREALEETQRRI